MLLKIQWITLGDDPFLKSIPSGLLGSSPRFFEIFSYELNTLQQLWASVIEC